MIYNHIKCIYVCTGLRTVHISHIFGLCIKNFNSAQAESTPPTVVKHVGSVISAAAVP